MALITPASGRGEGREIGGQAVEGGAVGDPRTGVDASLLDQSDDPGEVAGQGVA
jgi:hypothetical protein